MTVSAVSTGATPAPDPDDEHADATPDDGRAAASAPPDVLPGTLAAATTAADVLTKVKRIATWLGPWHDAIVAVRTAAIAPAGAATTSTDTGRDPDPINTAFAALRQAIAAANHLASRWCPSAAGYWLMGEDGGEATVRAVGPHAEMLAIALVNADAAWPHPKEQWHAPGGSEQWPQNPREIAEVALNVLTALEEASRHAALLLLVDRSTTARVGERVDVAAALAEWNLPADDTSKLLDWIAQDPPAFDGQRVSLAVDTASGSLYRTARTTWEKTYTTTAVLWGPVLGLGIVIAVFALLRAADITKWTGDWFPKMVVLYLCVVGGAAAHIASKSLANISFDDPLRIYASARGLDWLRLRWLSLLLLLIPIVVVTGSLWGAGDAPKHFKDIGVALLAGYSSDSLFRNSIARLSSAKS